MSIVYSPDLNGPAEFGCAQTGCRICQERLVRPHERLVHYVVRRQVTNEVEYADLLQVGRIGLWRAVLHFDAERGVTFSTYAVMAIQRHLGAPSARRGEGPRPPVLWSPSGCGGKRKSMSGSAKWRRLSGKRCVGCRRVRGK